MTTDIDQLLDTWTRAERAGDTATLDGLLTDDFVGIGPVGFVLDKPAWLGRFDHGLHYDQLALDEVSVRRHGEAAIVIAHQHAVGSHAGNPTPPDTRVSITILAGDDGGPKIAGMQYSFVGPPPGIPPVTAADTQRRAQPTYRPSWLQRRANTALTRALGKGRGPRFMRLLTVRGCRTGRARTTPVVPVLDGERAWVVSPFGEVGWVRNVRATGRVELSRGDDRTIYTARELALAEAVPVLRRYLALPARFFVRRYVNVTARSTDDAIAAEASRHPVFELTPVG
jgi:deazaflavin-dependent oxidoreductase (nitroreductase family)